MAAMIPDVWSTVPPATLIAGDGAAAAALALVMADAGRLRTAAVLAGPQADAEGAWPLVLDGLQQVILIPEGGAGVAECLQLHEGLWRWIERLSKAGGYQRVRCLWLLPEAGWERMTQGLATGLALKAGEQAAGGHGFVPLSASVAALMAAGAGVRPCDHADWQARLRADRRHQVLRGLLAAEPAAGTGSNSLRQAAVAVLECFRGQEHLLDPFCRPPEHRHGNRLRVLLQQVVTGLVTPECEGQTLAEIRSLIA